MSSWLKVSNRLINCRHIRLIEVGNDKITVFMQSSSLNKHLLFGGSWFYDEKDKTVCKKEENPDEYNALKKWISNFEK